MKKSEYLESQKRDFDVEKDLSINKYKLDEECLTHSSLYYTYSKACQDAKSEVTNAKNFLELVESQENLRIRNELTAKGTKFTEAVISSALVTNEKVIEAKEKLRKAEQVYSNLSVAVQAFEHRKSELDNLVKLYCSGYFSNPKTENKKGINEQVENEVRKNLNK